MRLGSFSKIAVFGLFMLSLALPLGSQGLEFQFNGVRFNNVILGFLPLPVGADLEFRLPLNKDGLFFSIRAAGGYEDRLILRNDADGSPLPKPSSFDNKQWFHWPNGQVDLGPMYRIALPGQTDISLEFFGLARGRVEKNSTNLSAGFFPDAQELFAFSAIGGLGLAGVENDSWIKRGGAAELSFEYGPSIAALAGASDFFRASARLEAYLPLFTLGSYPRNGLSSYLGFFAAGDFAGGSDIPLYVLTSFGGRHLRDGVGDSIRGYQPWGYEATQKAELSLDLRLVGPALFGVEGLRPIAYLFGDAGYYGGLYKCPSIADKNGLMFSAGAGAALGIFEFAYIGLRAGYRFPSLDPLFLSYFPGGEKFFWGITFLLHF
jgi:hypothetical protein